MKFILITGPQAVGKMTVGQELVKITNLKLLHNHMTIELLTNIFNYSRDAFRKLNEEFRIQIFEEFAKTDHYGMIFTYMWAFDQPSDWDYIEQVKNIFKPYGAEFYYVELVAPREVRLKRNRTDNRLCHKISKRDVALSEQRLLSDDAKYRLESREGEIPFENYMKIDNSNLEPAVVAKMIQERFHL